LSRAPIIREPFQHIYVRDVFPKAYYAEMLRNLPSDEQYGEERQYPHRRFLDPINLGGFWSELYEWMGSSPYIDTLYRKFQEVRDERFPGQDLKIGYDIRLSRDDPEYYLSPHTDMPSKFLSFLFYLPGDDRLKDVGTTIFRHKDPDYRHDGVTWLSFDDFEPVWTAPFMPNTCFAFARTDYSFHGVMPNTLGLVRNALMLNVVTLPV
jgi:hypothetical protein